MSGWLFLKRPIARNHVLAENKPVLYFTAQQRSSFQNLVQFSRAVYSFFDMPDDTGAFSDWASAFSYIAQAMRARSGEPFVLVFDEFPYAAETEPALPSVLQIAIDHEFLDLNMSLILGGSNEGFMDSLGIAKDVGRALSESAAGALAFFRVRVWRCR